MTRIVRRRRPVHGWRQGRPRRLAPLVGCPTLGDWIGFTAPAVPTSLRVLLAFRPAGDWEGRRLGRRRRPSLGRRGLRRGWCRRGTFPGREDDRQRHGDAFGDEAAVGVAGTFREVRCRVVVAENVAMDRDRAGISSTTYGPATSGASSTSLARYHSLSRCRPAAPNPRAETMITIRLPPLRRSLCSEPSLRRGVQVPAPRSARRVFGSAAGRCNPVVACHHRRPESRPAVRSRVDHARGDAQLCRYERHSAG